MKPIEFAEQNCTYAKDQPEYNPLPSFQCDDGRVISCWGLDWRERLRVLFTGRVWVSVMAFHQPLQPLLVQAAKPFEKTRKALEE
jgi:hypothetical protein